MGGKVTLLKLTLDWAIVGDDEPIALADRPAVKAIEAESDPRKVLALWAQTVVDIASRVAPVSEVLYAAADSDPAAAQLVANAAGGRMSGATEFVRHLASVGGLAGGVSEQQAADICWALMDGHLYTLLVNQRGWTVAAYRQRLSDSLTATLLS